MEHYDIRIPCLDKGRSAVMNKKELLDEIALLRAKIADLERIGLDTVRAAEQLRRSEEKYRNLVELTLDMIFMVDGKGRYTYVNPRFEKLTGYSLQDLIGRPFTCIVSPEAVESTITRFKQGIRGESMPPYEEDLIDRFGERIPVEFLVTTLYDSEGNASGRLGIGRDITERRKSDNALRQLAADLARAQSLAHIGNWRFDLETGESLWSEEMFRIFGLEPRPGVPVRIRHKKYIHPDDYPRYRESLRAAFEGTMFEVEMRIMSTGDKVCYIFTRGEAEFDRNGKVKRLFGTTQDVTERVLAQMTLKAQSEQLRFLSAKLTEAQESERKRIARELHDQVGQNLTVLGLNLNILRTAIDKKNLTSHHNSILDYSMQLVEGTSEFTRSLMSELRPPDMDDYGLVASIQWYVERFSARTGIEVSMKGKEIHPRPGTDMENNLFRIVQEALTNIRKHSKSRKATIRVDVRENRLIMKITDDGVGFNQSGPHKSPQGQGLGSGQGLGLINMAERAESLGGVFSIRSKSGKGTRITVEVPL